MDQKILNLIASRCKIRDSCKRKIEDLEAMRVELKKQESSVFPDRLTLEFKLGHKRVYMNEYNHENWEKDFVDSVVAIAISFFHDHIEREEKAIEQLVTGPK